MNLSRVFAAAAIAATISLNNAEAQTLTDGLLPAEFPPATYKGRQYVDSKGCVFIRAGIDGNVTWVPRVTRNRRAICGFQPTFARTARAADPAPQQAAPKRVAPQPQAQQPVRRKQARAVQPAAAAATLPQAPAQPRTGQAACRAGNAVSQPYVGRAGENVRCGPQAGSYATFVPRNKRQAAAHRDPGRSRQARVAPRHVYENQRASLPGISVPKGYKPAWDDDRLNPRRAHQTLAGKARMDQVWSQTVPRRLIRREAPANTAKNQPVQYVATKQRANTVTLSTRSAAAQTTPRKASHRYVQAGLFSTDAKARAAAKRISRAGLPARMGKVRYKGKTYVAVYAGPFDTRAQLDTGLQRVRAAGYRNATLRK